MIRTKKNGAVALALSAALAFAASGAMAQHAPGGGGHGGGPGGGGPGGGAQMGGGHGMGRGGPAEPERGPRGYAPVGRPSGAEVRPPQLDRPTYNHNFNADHGYHIGPYRGPRSYRYHRWGYGDILPRVFWGRQYWLLDYWLFGLDVPPVGFEWVRYGPDALLIDIQTGEVVQVIYGRFL